MKHNFTLLDIFIIAILCSCSGNQKNKSSIPVIDIEANVNNMQKIYLSEFSDNIRYVPLEYNSDHLFISIAHVDYNDKYILASNGGNCVLYDKNGHYIRSIGAPGRGPGEYGYIQEIALMNEKVYIRSSRSLFEFMNDGTFVKKYNDILRIVDMEMEDNIIMMNDSLIFGNITNLTGQTDFKALIINKSGDIKYSYPNYIKFKLEPGMSRADLNRVFIDKFGDNIIYKEQYDDTLFHLNNKFQLIPVMVFNMGKFKLQPETRGKKRYDDPSKIFIMGVYQTKDYLILPSSFRQNFPAKRLTPEIFPSPGGGTIIRITSTTAALGIFNKKTGTLVFCEPTSTDNNLATSGIYNDIDAGPRFMPDARMLNDSTLVMRIRFDYLQKHIASEEFKNTIAKYPEKKKRLKELTDSLTKTGFDSPVLMFVTFKK